MASRTSLYSVSREIARLSREGNSIVVTHGNGPQVGYLAMRERKSFAELTAQTEAWLGLEIEESIEAKGSKAAVVVTRVEVESHDAGFKHPTKPIGRFYPKEEAEALRKKGHRLVKLIHGYREVVASPRPVRVLGLDAVRELLSVDYVVIAGGGGGIAVSRGSHQYLNAVIDKDLTSSLIARELGADRLIILTNIDGAYIGFTGKEKRKLGRVGTREMRRYLKAGEFEAGSMMPKVEACLEFVKRKRIAAIGRLEDARDVFSLRRCTVITA